jgi:hypothetical protein
VRLPGRQLRSGLRRRVRIGRHRRLVVGRRVVSRGAFASYYSQVAPFLGGGGGCEDDLDGDGYIADSCGGNDCNDDAFAINPGAAEICGDLTDNNCNGLIDEDCGGGSCLPRGDACSSDDQCCSNKCHPRKGTCN